MTIDLAGRGVRLVLLDIEGTTTPITFVYDVLFPYARRQLRAFFRERPDGETRGVIGQLRSERTDDSYEALSWSDRTHDETIESAARYAEWLMNQDRKSPALKMLQGLIWDVGYSTGELCGEVFPDVPPALERWTANGMGCAIYSSGSELAQRLLFSSTRFGDLTKYLSGFYDTGVGAKRASASYSEISRRTAVAPGSILFVSDVAPELEAARGAGCQVVLCVRPGNPPQENAASFEVIRDFNGVA